MSLREKLLAKNSRAYKTVRDPDGDEWTIRSWTEREKAEHELVAVNRKSGGTAWNKLPEARIRAIVLSVVDPETNELVFTDDDVEQLSGVRSAVTSAIYAAILELNGFEQDEVEEMVGESG